MSENTPPEPSTDLLAVLEAIKGQPLLEAGIVANLDALRARNHEELRTKGVDPESHAAKEIWVLGGAVMERLLDATGVGWTAEDKARFVLAYWLSLLSPIEGG